MVLNPYGIEPTLNWMCGRRGRFFKTIITYNVSKNIRQKISIMHKKTHLPQFFKMAQSRVGFNSTPTVFNI